MYKHKSHSSTGRKLALFLGAIATLLIVLAAVRAHAAPAPAPASVPAAAMSAKQSPSTTPTPTAAPATLPGTVNLNTATEEELGHLPGVGPSKAAAIVAWRKKHGSFAKIDDLGHVKGFGRKTLLKLKPNLAVTGATTYAGKKAPPRAPAGHQETAQQ